MKLSNIRESEKGYQDFMKLFLHIRHKISAAFPGLKRFIRKSVLYLALNALRIGINLLNVSDLIDVPVQYNSYPLLEK